MQQKYEAQYFNSIKFIQQGKNGYYKNQKLGISMHRYVWEFYNGKIPKGYEIHHIDGNKSNNDISNLQCLFANEHKKLHGRNLTDEQREWRRTNINENVRPKAIEWHKSECGKQWHREQVNFRQDNRRIVKGTCLQCGKEIYGYNNQGHTKKFCSGACSQKYRRQNGLNNITKICEICGKEFITDKYRPKSTCSYKCGATLAYSHRKK